MVGLKTDMWVAAFIKRLQVAGVAAYVMRHGDNDAGALFLRVSDLAGHSGLLVLGTDFEGRRLWRVRASPDTTEAEIDELLKREEKYDPDFWVIEIEDRQSRHFLPDRIEGTWGSDNG